MRKTALFREKTVRLAGGALAAAMLIATVGVLGNTVGFVANAPVELSLAEKTTAIGAGYFAVKRCFYTSNGYCYSPNQTNEACELAEADQALCSPVVWGQSCSQVGGFGSDNCSGIYDADCPDSVVHECVAEQGASFGTWQPSSTAAPTGQSCGESPVCVAYSN